MSRLARMQLLEAQAEQRLDLSPRVPMRRERRDDLQSQRVVRRLVLHLAKCLAIETLVVLSVVLGGCRHDATCADSLMDSTTAALPTEWKDRGLTVPTGALLCEKPSPRDLHFVERTTESPEVRARQYEEALRRAGFTHWAATTPDETTPDEVVVHLMRGQERLVFNVYRVQPISGRVHPALVAGFGAATTADPPSKAPVTHDQ